MLAACTYVLAFISPLAADEVSSIFAPANKIAQERCVKIFGAGIGRVEGYGTGVLVSGEGHILTASGVMLSGERVFVGLPDGSRHQAKVERRSQNLQAAILKIEAKTPNYFDLADAGAAEQGDWVLGVSNCFKVADGTEHLSVNLGVVSLRTSLDTKHGVQDVPYTGEVLLIDAITSNPGAAGGAVVNIDGKLVGMIGRILESTDTGTRMNYAVPVDLLAKFYAGVPLDGEAPVARDPALGETYVGIKVFSLGIGSKALAYVDRVTPNSPGDKAGLRPDDLIVAIGTQTVHDIREYKKIVAQLAPGEEIVFLVKRKNDLVELPLTPVLKPTDK
jgi:serine protease Do